MSEAATTVIAVLKALLGDRLVTSRAIRASQQDMSYLPASMPDAVAFPQTEAEVQAIVKACAEPRCHIRLSMEGRTIRCRGGISVDTREMSRISGHELEASAKSRWRGTSATGGATMTTGDRRVAMAPKVCCKSTHKR